MFFSKKKKRKRFLCLRILCFFGIKGNYSVPQTVMCNYLNTTICFDLYGWHAQKIQKLPNSTPCFTLIEQALSAFFNVNYV